MKVMPSVLGQVGQNVADSLYEIGQGAVKGTVSAVADIAANSIEQITVSSKQAVVPKEDEGANGGEKRVSSFRKDVDNRRFNEVRSELDRYIQWKIEQDKKIAEEKSLESQQAKRNDYVEKKKRDNWINRVINRSQTSTEKGRLSE